MPSTNKNESIKAKFPKFSQIAAQIAKPKKVVTPKSSKLSAAVLEHTTPPKNTATTKEQLKQTEQINKCNEFFKQNPYLVPNNLTSLDWRIRSDDEDDDSENETSVAKTTAPLNAPSTSTNKNDDDLNFLEDDDAPLPVFRIPHNYEKLFAIAIFENRYNFGYLRFCKIHRPNKNTQRNKAYLQLLKLNADQKDQSIYLSNVLMMVAMYVRNCEKQIICIETTNEFPKEKQYLETCVGAIADYVRYRTIIT